MPNKSFHQEHSETKMIVMGGIGGVGKTTLSAALGLYFALQGRRVALLTIDPARRLGAALGFRKLGSALRRIPDSKLDPFRKQSGGALSAAMLDVKTTFDEMVGRYAPTPKIRDQILKNRFYGELSNALSGSHEYMAIEKIHQIASTGEYDLLILDTPPSSAMSDFLDAPSRLRTFLDRDIIRWFFPREEHGWKAFARAAMTKGVEQAMAMLDKLAGGHVFEEISQLLTDFQSLFDGLRDRTKEVERLLQNDRTIFFLVATSDKHSIRKLDDMADDLKKRKLMFGGIFLNRILPEIAPPPSELSNEEKLLREAAKTIFDRQNQSRKRIRKEFGDTTLLEIPLQEHDPATLDQLEMLFSQWK